MNWKPERSALENATNVLPKLVEKYFRAGRKAVDGKRSPDELHEFRIKTKAFRYTLELVHPVYGARLKTELEPLRKLQSVLGKLHDYHIIAEMLHGDHALQAKLQRRTKKKLKEFHEQWAKFDSKGELKRWKTLLAGPPKKSAAARRPGTKPGAKPANTTAQTTAA
jgi:CHAD domain-containing protein